MCGHSLLEANLLPNRRCVVIPYLLPNRHCVVRRVGLEVVRSSCLAILRSWLLSFLSTPHNQLNPRPAKTDSLPLYSKQWFKQWLWLNYDASSDFGLLLFCEDYPIITLFRVNLAKFFLLHEAMYDVGVGESEVNGRLCQYRWVMEVLGILDRASLIGPPSSRVSCHQSRLM